MSSNLSVQQILAVLSPTFRSIDVRTLSFSVDGAAYNVVTVIGFNEHDPQQVNNELKERVRNQPPFGDARLNFHFRVEPLERWSTLDSELRAGTVVSGSDQVSLMRSVQVCEFTGYIETIHFLRRRPDWPVFEAHGSWNPNQQDQAQMAVAQKLRWVQQDQDLIRNLNANGYRSLKDVFRAFLDSRPDSEPGYSSDIYVAVPVFAAVRQLRCSPTEGQLYVNYDCHPHLQSKVRVYGERRTAQNETERIQFSAPECPVGSSCVASGSLVVNDRTAAVNAWLGHSDLGHLTERSATARELLPPEEINPLWHLLQVFCPSETVGALLTAPPKPNDKRPKEQRYFEQHVAWMLGLHGFSVLVLGEFETLRTPGSAVEQGSLDILAFHRNHNRVLLASCTLAPPEERDFGNLVNVRRHLLSRINRDVSFRTDMAIFSSAAECVPPPHYAAGGTYVALFDAEDLRRTIADLNAGTDEEFFSKLDGSSGWGSGAFMPGFGFGY